MENKSYTNILNIMLLYKQQAFIAAEFLVIPAPGPKA